MPLDLLYVHVVRGGQSIVITGWAGESSRIGLLADERRHGGITSKSISRRVLRLKLIGRVITDDLQSLLLLIDPHLREFHTALRHPPGRTEVLTEVSTIWNVHCDHGQEQNEMSRRPSKRFMNKVALLGFYSNKTPANPQIIINITSGECWQSVL